MQDTIPRSQMFINIISRQIQRRFLVSFVCVHSLRALSIRVVRPSLFRTLWPPPPGCGRHPRAAAAGPGVGPPGPVPFLCSWACSRGREKTGPRLRTSLVGQGKVHRSTPGLTTCRTHWQSDSDSDSDSALGVRVPARGPAGKSEPRRSEPESQAQAR
jgi:hypothetical protein